ncbi:unnamed protein product [marine sediment metagenome]|uniref:Tyr recombinase domain-containing protein n=1 Tax=marine sediment metagenome TaxID=412755 RepID=X1MUA2_9ZZZZ
MSDENFPTVKDIRQRIDDMDTARKNGILYRNALRFIYLTASVVSEITGKRAPIGRDAYRTNIFGESAVLFKIKTAKRKGQTRSVAIPWDYDAWAEPLYNWFSIHEDSPPFSALTMRSFQREAGIVFKGFMWPIDEYQKAVKFNINDIVIIDERINGNGSTSYLIEFPSRERRWTDDPSAQTTTIVQERHWRPFTLQSLRQLRLWELLNVYNFSDDQIRSYTGLLGGLHDIRIPSTTSDDHSPSTQNNEKEIDILTASASYYFKNLLTRRSDQR